MLANDVIFGRSRFPGPLITQIRPLINAGMELLVFVKWLGSSADSDVGTSHIQVKLVVL